MNRIAGALCMWLVCSMNLQAQDPTPRREGFKMTEQIRTERIAFFTEKIGLTVEEAQTFWPVYHEMDKKKTDFFEERAGIVRRFMNEQDKLSEKEISKLLDRMVAIQQQETEIAVTYDARFRKLLPESKVMKYYMAEFQFRSFLLQKMRGKKGERRDN